MKTTVRTYHQIVRLADGTEKDLVISGDGRFIGMFPQDEDDKEILMGWHPDQDGPIPRDQWKANGSSAKETSIE